MINMTEISNMSPEQIIVYSNSLTTIPALLILYILSALVTLIVGLFTVEKHNKFLKIWVISYVISGLILVYLIYLPNSVQALINIFK